MGAFENTMELFTGGMAVTGMNYLDVLLRILCAMLAGLVVGWERELSRHPAGLRTNMLVSLGACIVMITAESICNRYAGLTNTDPARLGAQVICGVGFLGAGTIIHKGMSVQGLTTAASIWSVACLGLAAGNGDYFIVAVGTVLITIILSVLERMAKHLFRNQDLLVDLGFESSSLAESVKALNAVASRYDFTIRELQLEEKSCGSRVTVQVRFRGDRAKENLSQAMMALMTEPSIGNLGVKELQEHR